ncbi:MAG: hypothetical protein HYY40_10775 [Bacteroidetes bacterium]|nr:hypothetical protein [Bacteroidota bacterium]
MNPTYLHLLLNHFPITGTLIGFGILSYGLFSKSQQVKLLGIFIIVITALIAVPVFLTGEPAEESVEDIAGISKSIIETHEEAAELAFWLMEVTGLIALISVFFHYRKSGYMKHSVVATLLFSAVTFGAMARTGYLGGQIRHSEIRSNTTVIQNQQNENGEEDDDDD